MFQLQSLQKRLQAALLEHYKFRGLYNQGQIAILEQGANINAVRVGEVKSDIDVCLTKVASFLKGQFDDAERGASTLSTLSPGIPRRSKITV